MALASLPAMNITFSFKDQDPTIGKTRIHIRDPRDTLGAALSESVFLVWVGGAWTALSVPDLSGILVPAVAALSDAPITGVDAILSKRETARPQWGGGEAEMKAVILWQDAQGQPSFRQAIPGMKAALLSPDNRTLDPSNTLFTAYVTAMTTGTSGTNKPCSANGVNLVSVLGGDAYKQHRASHKRSHRRTG